MTGMPLLYLIDNPPEPTDAQIWASENLAATTDRELPVVVCGLCGRAAGFARFTFPVEGIDDQLPPWFSTTVTAPEWLDLRARVAKSLGVDPRMIQPGSSIGESCAELLGRRPGRLQWPRIVFPAAAGMWISAGLRSALVEAGVPAWRLPPLVIRGDRAREDHPRYFEVTTRHSAFTAMLRTQGKFCPECDVLGFTGPHAPIEQVAVPVPDDFLTVDYGAAFVLVSQRVLAVLRRLAAAEFSATPVTVVGTSWAT